MRTGASELIHNNKSDTPLEVDCPDQAPPGGARTLSPSEMRGKILELEASMKAMPEASGDQVGRIDIPTFHHFAPGVYMREIRIPKGATVVGMIHKTEHLNILSQGKLRLATEDGVRDVEASMVVKSTPGVKRAATALQDSVWITVHPNVSNEQDVEALKRDLVTETYEEFLEFMEKKEIAGGEICPLSP